MSLLALENVRKSYRDGSRERVVLRDASLEIEAGELIVVWGMRRSGRTTLLRVAAGIEAPDAGVVRFDGQDIATGSEDVLGAGIGYCRKTIRSSEGQSVLDQVLVGLLAGGMPTIAARSHAQAALARAGVEQYAQAALRELNSAELIRVALARTIALAPRLLIVDEPTSGVELHERDGMLLLLRSLADEGIAVLASASDATQLAGADRALALSDGELRGPSSPELAPIVPLRPTAGISASG
jgi:ABC-type cobalamin/Fe3+-siderophores transport system ATPase subunit